MGNQATEQLNYIMTFSFPAIFNGLGTIVTVNNDEDTYQVLIDDNYYAKIKLEADFNHWFISEGELNDPDLVKEIGDRIQAKYLLTL